MLIGLGQLPATKTALSPTPTAVAPAASQAELPQPGDSLTEAQVKQYSTDPRLLTVALWAQNPDEAAKLEATALMTALESLKGEAVPLAKELQKITQTVAAKRASVQRMRAEIAALSRQGMGEILALERETGVWVDPFMSGIMSSIRKGFKDIDKAAIRPWSQPLHEGLKEADRALIRPWSKPLHAGLKQLDRWVIRPWSVPLNTALKKIDKYTIRPAAREVGKGIAVLDKFVPGWTMVLDFVMPIPLGTILGALAGKSLVSTIAGRMFPGSELIGNLAKVGDQSLNQAFMSAKSFTTPGTLGGTMPLTLAKGTHTFIKTKGPFLTKLRATATEAVQGFALVLTIAVTVASFGTATPAMLAALSALQALNAGLQSGINVLNANEAAQALKKQARLIRAAGNAELAKIEEEERQTLAEIAKLKANIEAIKRQRMKVVKPSLAPSSRGDVVAQTAESLGVSETTMIVGGLALIGGVVLIVSLTESE